MCKILGLSIQTFAENGRITLMCEILEAQALTETLEAFFSSNILR